MISPGALVDGFNNLTTMVFGSASSEPTADGGYDPSPMDVFVVREMLSRAIRLPPDIVDVIFDYAEYWAHSTNYIDYLEEHKEPMRVTGSSELENRFLVSIFPSAAALYGSEPRLTAIAPLCAYWPHHPR
jgi:hypothetical protein